MAVVKLVFQCQPFFFPFFPIFFWNPHYFYLLFFSIFYYTVWTHLHLLSVLIIIVFIFIFLFLLLFVLLFYFTLYRSTLIHFSEPQFVFFTVVFFCFFDVFTPFCIVKLFLKFHIFFNTYFKYVLFYFFCIIIHWTIFHSFSFLHFAILSEPFFCFSFFLPLNPLILLAFQTKEQNALFLSVCSLVFSFLFHLFFYFFPF